MPLAYVKLIISSALVAQYGRCNICISVCNDAVIQVSP